MNTALPIFSYMYVRGQEYDFKLTKENFWYSFSLDGFLVNDIQINQKKLLEFAPHSLSVQNHMDKALHVQVEGIDLDISLTKF